MNIFKKQIGITLISLIVTIIVLLILAGVTLSLTNTYIVNKSVLAYSRTVEEMLKEKIEMTLVDVQMSYLMEKDNISITKENYYNEKIKEFLEKTDGLSNVSITEGENSKNSIEFLYNNKSYFFEVDENGKITIGNSVKSEIKIGDYVEYPVTYTDMYTEQQYTASNGWRVIDNGIIDGTSGYIKIISTGVPRVWNYDYENDGYESNEAAVIYLLNNFENIKFTDLINGGKSKGSIFNDKNLASKVSTITFEDINLANNKLYGTNVDLSPATTFQDSQGLFNLNTGEAFFYWIANAKENTNDIYYISDEGISSDSLYRIGIRPVVYLKNGLSGKFENNVWKFTK